MTRILHFIYGLHVGGAETFIVNSILNLNKNTYHFDFAIQDPNITNPTIDELKKRGEINIYKIPKFPQHLYDQYRHLKNLILNNQYDIVHIHYSSAINPVPLILCKILKNCNTSFILHSHNVNNNLGGLIGRFIHKFNTRLLVGDNIGKMACSDIAAKWMFKGYDSTKYSIISNAIDVSKIQYHDSWRESVRIELNIPASAKVIGNLGRFVYAKNHRFMLNLFGYYSKTHPDALLLLVGEGPLLEEMKTLSKQLKIKERVIFTGLRTDVPQLLSAMDCFLFPSHFEGLGFTAIEAEACGLNVIASDKVPEDINQKGYVNFLSLNDSLEKWSRHIDLAISHAYSSDRKMNPILNSKYDIDRMIGTLDEIYNRFYSKKLER